MIKCSNCHCFLAQLDEGAYRYFPSAHIIRYPCGATIFEQASPVAGIYIVCQGGGFIRFVRVGGDRLGFFAFLPLLIFLAFLKS